MCSTFSCGFCTPSQPHVNCTVLTANLKFAWSCLVPNKIPFLWDKSPLGSSEFDQNYGPNGRLLVRTFCFSHHHEYSWKRLLKDLCSECEIIRLSGTQVLKRGRHDAALFGDFQGKAGLCMGLKGSVAGRIKKLARASFIHYAFFWLLQATQWWLHFFSIYCMWIASSRLRSSEERSDKGTKNRNAQRLHCTLCNYGPRSRGRVPLSQRRSRPIVSM